MSDFDTVYDALGGLDSASDNEAVKDAFLRIATDAKRYKWLKDRDLDAIDKGGLFVGQVPQNVVINGADLDKEIDAAIYN